MNDLVYIIDLLGSLVFAISGASTAAEKKFDLFGAGVIAFVTAVGGGTIRDVLIGSQPVGWMKDINYLIVIGAAVGLTYFFRIKILRLRRTLFLFDSIGLGLFTVLGLQKTLAFELSPVVAIIMGTVSAVFGGVIRDIITNEVPLILRKEIYATACIAGGGFYLMMSEIVDNQYLNITLSIGLIILIRILAVIKKWSLPTIN